MELLAPLTFGSVTAPNRVLFGPHVTNLGDGRALSARHVAYYERRAAGGCGVLVVETASVHPLDWPYERAPLAELCGPGWAAVVAACRPHGTVVLAGLGHAGGQGTSHWSQRELWAPSDEPEVDTREVPKVMEPGDIDAVVAGFAEAAAGAVGAGCDGVEINAGQHSLVRQFLSGLTNRRDDEYGADRLLFARRVLAAVRSAVGDGVVAVRFSGDELAPWAGITSDDAPGLASALVDEGVDLLVVERGSIFSVPATRPDTHTPPLFNRDLCRSVRGAVGDRAPVVLQGSVVDVADAETALVEGVADAVEMTRAQIADPDLVERLRRGRPERIRPCLLCNQRCRVRDNRNPIVTCVVEPRSGHETIDPDPVAPRPPGRPAFDLLVVGGGPAGLEAARVAAERGHAVRLVEATGRLGGAVTVAAAAAGRRRLGVLVAWYESELVRLGVAVETGRAVTPDEVAAHAGPVVVATGSVPGPGVEIPGLGEPDTPTLVDAATLLAAERDGTRRTLVPEGARVVVVDPVGGPVGVSVAETLAPDHPVALVVPDAIAGQQLDLTGDLAPANVRLAQAGVELVRRSVVRCLEAGGVLVADPLIGTTTHLAADLVVDAGHRLPDPTAWPLSETVVTAGDAVAPRTVHEAVLEARRAVGALEAAWTPHRVGVDG